MMTLSADTERWVRELAERTEEDPEDIMREALVVLQERVDDVQEWQELRLARLATWEPRR